MARLGSAAMPWISSSASGSGTPSRPSEYASWSAPYATVYAVTLRLPAGTYAYKLAYGRPGDAANPPTTLETVTKGLATRNDLGGVAIDPVTLIGADVMEVSPLYDGPGQVTALLAANLLFEFLSLLALLR